MIAMERIVAVTLPHLEPRSLLPGAKSAVTCSVAIEIEVGEAKDGEDPSYLYTEDYGRKCESCGHVFSPAERRKIDEMAIEAAKKDDELDDDLDEDLDDDDDEELDFDDDEDDDLDDDDDDFDDENDDDLDDLDDDDDVVDDELENPRERVKNERDMFRYE